MKRRIFYFNITYACNNSCKYCISTNVKQHASRVITIEDIEAIDNAFHIQSDDLIVLSGGEPILSPLFTSIIDYAYNKTPFINIYTNGRCLNILSNTTLNKINRIILPIYGNKEMHNNYVQNNRAFSETVNNILNILEKDCNKVDIKLMICDSNNIIKLMESEDWDNINNNKNFSVTRVLSPSNIDVSHTVAKQASSIIKILLESNKNIRLYDIPICMLNSDIQRHITQQLDFSLVFDPIVICGSTDKHYKLYEFNNQSTYFDKCRICGLKQICVQIMKNYFCPRISNGITTIDTE